MGSAGGHDGDYEHHAGMGGEETRGRQSERGASSTAMVSHDGGDSETRLQPGWKTGEIATAMTQRGRQLPE